MSPRPAPRDSRLARASSGAFSLPETNRGSAPAVTRASQLKEE